MDNLKSIIANNISNLRTQSGMTQLGLGETLHYSDKAVSKWERGESIPDIAVLKEIADMFHVTVDYLLQEHDEVELDIDPIDKDQKEEAPNLLSRSPNYIKLVITLITNLGIVVASVIAFVILGILFGYSSVWIAFIYMLPVCAITTLVLNCIWGRYVYTFILISIMIWTTLLSIFLSCLLWGQIGLWQVFLIGIPLQIIVVFAYILIRLIIHKNRLK